MGSASPGGARAGYAWWAALLGSALLVGAVEAVLLQLGPEFFGSGFNGEYVRGALELSAFAGASLLVDGAVLLALWTLLLPLFRRAGLSPLPLFVGVVVLALGSLLVADSIRWQIYRVLGDMLSFERLWQLAEGDAASVVAEAVAEVPTVWLMAVIGATGFAGILAVARLLEPVVPATALRPPRTSRLAVAAVLAMLTGATLVTWTATAASKLHYGLTFKPSGILLTELTRWATDFDRDGFGWLSVPADPAPFDAAVNPFALESPGNGIDEDGFAGDLPLGFPPPHTYPVEATSIAARPPVLLVFLETFRSDVVGRRHQGRPVTPVLERIAEEGASTAHAYVHSPLTAPSRAQLLTGDLFVSGSATTILDDFRAAGYTIAYFSGQHEGHGSAFERLGLDRVDHFYDARQDLDRRSSRSTAPVSLQVSWRVLLERVSEFLASEVEDPIFLYVNIVDAHHPYHHAELDDLLGVRPVARSEIRPENADAVRATYLNAVANVDEAVGELVARFRERVGDDFVLVVTADHGQAFYEKGFLGHGQSLGADQSRVPLLLKGVGGTWPEPIGLADLRGLLARYVFAPRGSAVRPRFVPDPDREVFQYLGTLERPRVVGIRTLERAVLYDMRRDRLEILAGDEKPLDPVPTDALEARDDVLRRWEALRLRMEEGEGPGAAGRRTARGSR